MGRHDRGGGNQRDGATGVARREAPGGDPVGVVGTGDPR